MRILRSRRDGDRGPGNACLLVWLPATQSQFKVSTRVYHLRRKQHQQYRKVPSRLDDLEIFGEVEDRDFRAIAAFFEIRQYAKNSYLYEPGDPSHDPVLNYADILVLVNVRESDGSYTRHFLDRVVKSQPNDTLRP